MEAHINFVQVNHKSPLGIQSLQLDSPITPGLFFVDTMPGTSTFTQAGNITPPHIDGFGLIQQMAYFDGDKIWIVWLPMDANLQVVWDHFLSLGPKRENQLENWLRILDDPQLFIMHPGDSFFLGPSVIHACIALTPRAHYGVFCWRQESLDIATLNLSIFKQNHKDLVAEWAEIMRKREKGNKKKLTALEKANRDTDWQEEDNLFHLSMEFYRGEKREWTDTDSKAWNQIRKGWGSDEQLDLFMKEAKAFFSKSTVNGFCIELLVYN